LHIQTQDGPRLFANTDPRSVPTDVFKAAYISRGNPFPGIDPYNIHAGPTARYSPIYPELNFFWAKDRLRLCDDHHSDLCSTIEGFERSSIVYLIDVENQCLVEANSQSYVALSYVWGPVSTEDVYAKCCIDSLPQMLRKGYFDSKKETVPLLVRNAITFCEEMGQKYLWVDRYCIVQDLPEQKHQQLKVMGSIYHKAYFTIIAADGDAMTGLRGFPTDLHEKERSINIIRCEEAGLTFRAQYDTIAQNTTW
jgi:hypothetical protein